MQKDLSVIIPVFNEEENIAILHSKLCETVSKITANYELIFVNDGSKDATIDELIKLANSNSNTYYINFSRNFGHQIAVTAGLNNCNGKSVVIIDGDMQDPPELIEEMYSQYKQGFDVVYARRNKREGESFLKKITAKWFYRILKKITNIEIPLDTGDYRLIDAKVVEYLKKMPEQNKFLRGQIAWLGFKSTEVLFNRDKRLYGETKYTYSKMFRFAFDAITGFSDKPLLFVSKLGLMISLFSLAVIIYALYSHFVTGHTVSGWTSLIISSTFIGGIQLISVGVIGEYISRINKNVQNRPLYIIENTNLKVDHEI